MLAALMCYTTLSGKLKATEETQSRALKPYTDLRIEKQNQKIGTRCFLIMTTNINDSFYRKLEYKRIKISKQNTPIKMSLFLSFLTVDVTKSTNHLGIGNGWTQYYNNELSLTINGGFVDSIEYLDSIKYGERKHNQYNDFITPFQMFDLLTTQGKSFFLSFYRDDINDLISNIDSSLKKYDELKQEAINAKVLILDEIIKLVDSTQGKLKFAQLTNPEFDESKLQKP